MGKILIEMEKLKDIYCGLGQFCLHLAENFENAESTENEIELLVPRRGAKDVSHIKKIKKHRLRKLHKKMNYFLPKSDLFHATHQDSEFLPKNTDSKYLLTIHDLFFLYEPGFSEEDISFYINRLQKKIDRADALAFDTDYSKQDVLKHLKVEKNIPMRVIHCGVTLREFENLEKPNFVPKSKFLFTVGTVLPRKNFKSLVPLVKEFSEYELVIAGANQFDYANEIIDFSKELGVEDRVHLVGKINEEEKVWYHKNCDAFLFPSHMEGFGLPPVESMTFGKPLFLSNRTSLPEIGGDLAYYFDDFSKEAMIKVFKEGMEHFKANPELKDKLMKRRQMFNWKKASLEYLDLYNEVLKC